MHKTNPKPKPLPTESFPKLDDRVRYSASLVTQGSQRFYTLTMPSEVLAACCFATSREEDAISGFQRVLDSKRAQEIADYMDSGLGTIPNSIVLSAQPEALMKSIGRGKTLEFTFSPHAFLIIDGQHRVFGFSLANTKLRVPVVIYNGLSKQQESRLFMDINTKQRPVPNELLLDIKKLADAESDEESTLRELFDTFNEDLSSPVIGLMSPSAKAKGKISRVTFNAAVKPILTTFASSNASGIYPALKGYLSSVHKELAALNLRDSLINPTVFRAVFEIFPEVAQRVLDRHGASFQEENFTEILAGMLARTKVARIKTPPKSHKDLANEFSRAIRSGFLIN